MIKLVDGINSAFVTLKDRQELASADILVNLVFRDETSKNKVIKTADIAPAENRVNEVQIEVVATVGLEDLDNAKIFLQSGFYKYEIYESDDGTRDITGKKLLETGVLIYDLNEQTTDYERTTTETIYTG